MLGALNPFRAKVIAAIGALILHATAFGALAFAELGGPKLAFDGAPAISVTITTAPPQTPLTQTNQTLDLKAAKPKPRKRMLSEDASTVSEPDEATARALTAPADFSQTDMPAERAGTEVNPYAQKVWRRLAAYRPRSVSGAKQARVQFVLDASGAVTSALVVASSGSIAFDRACLQAVQRAAPFPPDANETPQSAAFEVVIYAQISR